MKLLSPELKTLLVEGEKAKHSGANAQLYVSVDGSVVDLTVPVGAATVPVPLKLYATPKETTKLFAVVVEEYVKVGDQGEYTVHCALTKSVLIVVAVVVAHRYKRLL